MSGFGVAAGISLLLAAQVLAPATADAGVPRSCVHPHADPIQCPSDTRRVLHRVIPWARLQVLERQREQLDYVAPSQDRERNRLLEDIDGGLRCGRGC